MGEPTGRSMCHVVMSALLKYEDRGSLRSFEAARGARPSARHADRLRGASSLSSGYRFPPPPLQEAPMSSSTHPTTTLLAGRKLVQVALTTRDPERSRAFYRDVLGLQLLFAVTNMTFYQLGDLRLMVGVEPSMAPGGSVLYIDAPDIDTLGTELEQRGVRFGGGVTVVQRTEKGDLKLREFKDPDGNSLALMGFVPR